MDDEDDFFGDGIPHSQNASSTLLKNIVASDEASHSRDYSLPKSTHYHNNSPADIPRDYEDIRQVSSGSTTSPDTVSPVSRKPPLPPADAHRLAHSLAVSADFDENGDDRPDLKLDLSNLKLTKPKKKKKKSSKTGSKSTNKANGDTLPSTYPTEKHSSKVKSKIKVPTGSPTRKSYPKKTDFENQFEEAEKADSCSTCQSSSSTLSNADVDEFSEQSDVTSVSPLNSPPPLSKKKKSSSLVQQKRMAVPSTKTRSTNLDSEDLFRLMRRLIDDVDTEQRVSRARGQQAWANYSPTDVASTSALGGAGQNRHPTLGEIIQSLSKYNSTKSVKSSSSKAPSIASGGSGFTTTSNMSKASTKSSAIEPPRRRHHAAINRDKRQREIAAENIRIFQRLQTVRASPELSRTRQLAEWQRQVSFGSGASSSIGTRPYSSLYDNRSSFGVAPLSGLIGTAGRGGKPRPQSAVSYLNTPSSQAYSVKSEQPSRHHHREGGNRPSSGSIHGRTLSGSGPSQFRPSGNVYMGGIEYQYEGRAKSRPISGHF